MKFISTLILVILIFLAVSSGIMKIILSPQEVEFFGRYGFSNPLLMAFGAAQLIGGTMMAFEKTRFAGATIVAVSFLVSLAVLMMDGNIPVSIVTGVATLLLGSVMYKSWNAHAETPTVVIDD